DRLDETAGRKDEVSIGNIVETLGNRSYGPFLIVPALLELSPIGGIPGVPTLLAAIIILFAGQMVLGRRHFWLPRLLAGRSTSADLLKKSTRKMRPLGRWLDRWFHGRLSKLTSGPFIRMAAAACIGLALTVPPLELFPFASSAPMAAIAMFGLGLLVRDGVLMIIAGLLTAATTAVGFGMLGSSG
ncbi:MAG TPA: exopolysaccharide biosynthesis protein, partial [Arenibaculum sp.]|nr:exopolysaccharide biosynthesis protein [Arenibaculum sp.]